MKTIIIGGVAGGATAAARLRRLDEQSEIILFERGEFISFANCGLPYHIGGTIESRDALLVQTPEGMRDRFNIDVRINSEVVSIDRQNKKVKVLTKDGKKYEESYDTLILSPGSTPLKPPIKGIDSPNIFSLWNIPDMDRIIDYVKENKPKRAAVIGGGFIGIEMAENLYDLGLEVSIVEMANQVMAPLDFDMAQIVHKHLRTKGISLILEDGVSSFEYKQGETHVHLNSGEKVDADMVILSIGIRPNSSLAKEAGLELNARGGIVTNDYTQTSDPHIYAIGDASQINDFMTGQKTMIPLAGPANKQGRIAADNIANRKVPYKGAMGTSVAKVFDLTVSATGLNEKQLIKMGKKYGKDFYSIIIHPNSHAGYYPGAMNMSLKLVFGADGKILGAQNVGYNGVEKRIDVIATSIHFGSTVSDLAELELAYAPPYSSAKDPVNMAGFVAENVLNGTTDVIAWHELRDLYADGKPSDGSINKPFIIDVRTDLEHELGSIEHSIHIPIDELRSRMSEFNKDSYYIVYCAVGIRGYAALRILKQKGISHVRNLSGGYTTYCTAIPDFAGRSDEFCIPCADTIHANEMGDVEIQKNSGKQKANTTTLSHEHGPAIELNACGLQCPGPILKTYLKMETLKPGDVLEVKATDPGFASDIKVWAQQTGNTLLESGKRDTHFYAKLQKGGSSLPPQVDQSSSGDDKTMIVFSGDLDKAIASLIIANGAASMGKKTTLFFTFWGLNILRKTEKVKVKKDFISKMFGSMMPRGTKKLGLSQMNMMGMGPKMIRSIMKKKGVSSLEELLQMALDNGVKLVACNMTMDLLGIKKEELIDGVELGGVATMLGAAENSNMSLFI